MQVQSASKMRICILLQKRGTLRRPDGKKKKANRGKKVGNDCSCTYFNSRLVNIHKLNACNHCYHHRRLHHVVISYSIDRVFIFFRRCSLQIVEVFLRVGRDREEGERDAVCFSYAFMAYVFSGLASTLSLSCFSGLPVSHCYCYY